MLCQSAECSLADGSLGAAAAAAGRRLLQDPKCRSEISADRKLLSFTGKVGARVEQRWCLNCHNWDAVSARKHLSKRQVMKTQCEPRSHCASLRVRELLRCCSHWTTRRSRTESHYVRLCDRKGRTLKGFLVRRNP